MKRRATMRTSGSRPVPITWLDPVAASPIDLAVGGLLIIVLGLLGMVWGAGFLSSLIINGEAPELSIGDAAVAMARLGRNRFVWDGVWPANVEPSMAGPFWFWLVFLVEAVIVGLLFWPMWRLFGPRPADPMSVVIEDGAAKHPRRDRREAERAARRTRRLVAGVLEAPPSAPDSGKILIDGPPNGRLVLGLVGKQLVAADKHHSVLALGPTGSGKTSSLALPAVFEWRGPVVVVSTKADMVRLAHRERSRRAGETWLFDPTGLIGRISDDGRRSVPAQGWSPLEAVTAVPRPRDEPDLHRRIRQWVLARRSAQWMVSGVGDAVRPADVPTPWYGVVEQMLGPLLLAAAAEELPIGQVVEWVDRREQTAVAEALVRAGVAEAEAAWSGAHRYDEATTVGCYQILASILYPFGDPVVRAQFRDGQISARTLLDGKPNTLFVLSPANHQNRLRPLLTTMISEVVDTAMNQALSSPSGRLEQPLLIVIDDAAGCAPIDLLDRLASVGAGLGIQLLTLAQDLNQLGRHTGQASASHLADSHQARVVLPGITDPFTLDYLNVLIRGTRLTDPGQPASSEDGGDDAIVSTTAGWMRTLDDGAAVLIYGNLAPIRMKLRPWYADKALVGRLQPAPPSAKKKRWWLRGRPDDLMGGGFPNPFDSAANDREAERYWESVRASGLLPEAMEYNDGTSSVEKNGPIR